MRVLVCGGRKITMEQSKFIYGWLCDCASETFGNYSAKDPVAAPLTIINGAARGVDSVASEWARDQVEDAFLIEYPADWQKHGKAAGYIRNKQMLEEGKPDLVIAFPGGKGTAMMVRLAKEAGVPVEEVQYVEK